MEPSFGNHINTVYCTNCWKMKDWGSRARDRVGGSAHKFKIGFFLLTICTVPSMYSMVCSGSWTRPARNMLVHNNLSNYAIKWPWFSFSNVILIICKFYCRRPFPMPLNLITNDCCEGRLRHDLVIKNELMRMWDVSALSTFSMHADWCGVILVS